MIATYAPMILHEEGTICVKIGIGCNSTDWLEAFRAAGLKVEIKIAVDSVDWQAKHAIISQQHQSTFSINSAHLWVVGHRASRGWYYSAPKTCTHAHTHA